ncbi:hypothetical protein K3495_g9342 [Podosphaera aphanis]|nr:hypothetical protein K3495_g9342 [Podosphaera aphanis]
MNLFSYIRSIYTLDTIDTRFTSSSSIPYRAVIEARKNRSPPKDHSVPGEGVKTDYSGRPIAQPSKWSTPEFYFYYLVFIVVVPSMFWVAYDVSRPSDPNYHKFEHLLSPGWVPGRKIDASDPQYSTFRENLPYLGALVLLHPLCRRLYNLMRYTRKPLESNRNSQKHQEIDGDLRLEQRVSFDILFTLVFLTFLHGFSAVKIIIILYANYNLAVSLPRKFVPAMTWIFNILILFANELCNGYKFARVAEFLSPVGAEGPSPYNWGNWLDSYGGIMSRWEILFNLTVLRLISFNLDYYWSQDPKTGNILEVGTISQSNQAKLIMPRRNN